MYEPTTGFCLLWGADGIPYLDECSVERVSDQVFLMPLIEDGRVVAYDNLAFGIDFFYNKLPAQTALVEQLGEAVSMQRTILRRTMGKLDTETERLEEERRQEGTGRD